MHKQNAQTKMHKQNAQTKCTNKNEMYTLDYISLTKPNQNKTKCH